MGKKNRNKKPYQRAPTANTQGATATMPKYRINIINTGYSKTSASMNKNTMKGWDSPPSSPNSDILANLSVLRGRARGLRMGGAPMAGAAINTSRVNVIGSGLTLSAAPDRFVLGLSAQEVRDWARKTQKEFDLWANSVSCDALRMNNFYDMQDIVFTGYLDNGDGWALFKYEDILPDMPYSLRLHIIEADRIRNTNNINTGASKGLELIDMVFPYFRLIPGTVISPGWSTDPEVAMVMAAKVKNISGVFWGIALADIPTDIIKKYADAPNWKNQNNISDKMLVSCWPKLALTEKQFYLSTQLAGLICRTDAENGDVPYKSPSNENLQSTGTVLKDGTEVMLIKSTAEYLNGQGVVTGFNFIGGWKSWGNRTSIYPASTDPKDSFIAIRRMFNWINNTLITTFWNKIDKPMNKREIDTIVGSANVWLNGLTAQQYILGGRVEFNRDENPDTDLMDGIIRFHVYVTPPSPMRQIEFIHEYDVSYLATLFGEG